MILSAKKNPDEKVTNTKDEFLTRFKKTDRLHPVITLCIYYGEKEWNGATSLKEMLVLPDYIESPVPDYKMNLIQLRNSENLKFKNKDVQTISDISRLIYGKNYDKITSIYKDRNLTNELGIVIGIISTL
ncbi:Rpn family recombination-promoting nuclease/putative transposase [Coprococcus comes]|uniref:Rpn family recombination-promoting nuclease/putative transposase n=1 Tax=Coprococcus comes TaxID=410072 RepID=UPI0034A3F8D9